jgi:hypothetical protein
MYYSILGEKYPTVGHDDSSHLSMISRKYYATDIRGNAEIH